MARMLQREIDAETAADIAKFERHARALPRRRPGRGRLPGVPPEQRHLRPAPGRPQPDGAHQGSLRRHHAPSSSTCWPTSPTTYSRGWGHITTRQNVQFHFVAARAGPRGHAPAGRGRAHHPRGLRRHRAQRDGLPPGRRLPVRGPRHQPVGRGRLPALPAPPVSPSACPASSRSTSRAAPPTAARPCSTTSAWSPSPAPLDDGTIEPGFRVFVAGGLGANPHPAQALEEFTRQGGPAAHHRGGAAGLRPLRQPRQQAAGPPQVGGRRAGHRRAARRIFKERQLLLASSQLAGRHPRRRRRSSATPRPAWPPASTPTPSVRAPR